MSADVIRLVTASGRKQRRGGRKRNAADRGPLIWEARQALRLLQQAIEARGVDEKRADLLLKMAERQLAAGIEAHIDNAKRDVGRIVMDALGPDTTCGEIQGARKALSLILRALPVYNDT
jgi:hypothetical protein